LEVEIGKIREGANHNFKKDFFVLSFRFFFSKICYVLVSCSDLLYLGTITHSPIGSYVHTKRYKMTFFNGFCCYSNSITQLNLHASLFFENEVVGGVKGGEGNIMTTHSTLSLCQHLVWWAFLEDIISLCSSGILFFNYFCFV